MVGGCNTRELCYRTDQFCATTSPRSDLFLLLVWWVSPYLWQTTVPVILPLKVQTIPAECFSKDIHDPYLSFSSFLPLIEPVLLNALVISSPRPPDSDNPSPAQLSPSLL